MTDAMVGLAFAWAFVGFLMAAFGHWYLCDARHWDDRPATAVGALVVIAAPLAFALLLLLGIVIGVRYLLLGFADLGQMFPRKPKIPRAEVRR